LSKLGVREKGIANGRYPLALDGIKSQHLSLLRIGSGTS